MDQYPGTLQQINQVKTSVSSRLLFQVRTVQPIQITPYPDDCTGFPQKFYGQS